jgi:CheY-like chemotaxis protein
MPSVLIADDNPFILETLAARLRSNGHNVITAANGEEAVERGAALYPDLAILDASMPVMSGLEAAERLHQILPRLPIILFTAYADALRSQSYQSGVVAIFDKSSSLSDLLDTVDESFRRSEKRA